MLIFPYVNFLHSSPFDIRTMFNDICNTTFPVFSEGKY